jgi:hypothetical protein
MSMMRMLVQLFHSTAAERLPFTTIRFVTNTRHRSASPPDRRPVSATQHQPGARHCGKSGIDRLQKSPTRPFPLRPIVRERPFSESGFKEFLREATGNCIATIKFPAAPQGALTTLRNSPPRCLDCNSWNLQLGATAPAMPAGQFPAGSVSPSD